ncbi:hypothetical protein K438DRAFT_261914 [Mycena galopus ATCC 62051]|nr:hypothetical protein K438DRAFT_261914 [Mycena galopus ATCC 62051]
MAFRSSILNSVPTEILREIASAVEVSNDKAAFCRVSRLFNVIAVPVLYRHIHLDSVERTLACLFTLGRNPKRHDDVRSLRIAIVHSHGLVKIFRPWYRGASRNYSKLIKETTFQRT